MTNRNGSILVCLGKGEGLWVSVWIDCYSVYLFSSFFWLGVVTVLLNKKIILKLLYIYLIAFMQWEMFFVHLIFWHTLTLCVYLSSLSSCFFTFSFFFYNFFSNLVCRCLDVYIKSGTNNTPLVQLIMKWMKI